MSNVENLACINTLIAHNTVTLLTARGFRGFRFLVVLQTSTNPNVLKVRNSIKHQVCERFGKKEAFF